MIETYKNIVAKENGFPDWKTLYDFTAREGEKPCVVAQLIETYMVEVLKKVSGQGFIISRNFQNMTLKEFTNKL